MGTVLRDLTRDLKKAVATNSYEEFKQARHCDRVKMIPYMWPKEGEILPPVTYEEVLEYAELTVHGLNFHEREPLYSHQADIIRTWDWALELCLKRFGIEKAVSFLHEFIIPALEKAFSVCPQFLYEFTADLSIYKIGDNADYRNFLLKLAKNDVPGASFAAASYIIYDTEFTHPEKVDQRIGELRKTLRDPDTVIACAAAEALGILMDKGSKEFCSKYIGEILDDLIEVEKTGTPVAGSFYSIFSVGRVQDFDEKEWFMKVLTECKPCTSLDFYAYDTVLDEPDIETLKKIGRPDLAEQLKNQVEWDKQKKS